MKQRLLAGLLAVVLVLGLAPAALAAAPAEEEAAQVLAALDIMVGDESGNLNLGATVTRAEFTKLAVAASTSRDAVGDTVSVKPYPDVPQSHWAAPYIKAAVDLGLVQGDLHGNFNPGRSITLAEGVTIVLRLLGYQDSGPGGSHQLRYGGPRGGRRWLAVQRALRRRQRHGLPQRLQEQPGRGAESGRGVLVGVHAYPVGLLRQDHRHL